jgi:hypothetical protein
VKFTISEELAADLRARGVFTEVAPEVREFLDKELEQ